MFNPASNSDAALDDGSGQIPKSKANWSDQTIKNLRAEV